MCDTKIPLELLFAKNSGLLEKGITNRSLAFNHFLRGGFKYFSDFFISMKGTHFKA